MKDAKPYEPDEKIRRIIELEQENAELKRRLGVMLGWIGTFDAIPEEMVPWFNPDGSAK